MIEFIKKCWRGEENFWKVFLIWVVPVNVAAVWFLVFLKTGLSLEEFKKIPNILGVASFFVLIFVYPTIYLPISLRMVFVSRSNIGIKWLSLFLITIYSIYVIPIFLFFSYGVLWGLMGKIFGSMHNTVAASIGVVGGILLTTKIFSMVFRRKKKLSKL